MCAMGAADDPQPGPDMRERYTVGYEDANLRFFQMRTLAMCAPFLLPHLRPGLTALDVGCGPGSMTIELAQHVAPAEVIGVDLEISQFERARAAAAERGVRNIQFKQGDAYELPFPDASFDLVFSHAILSHLREPARALAEMRRVLRPGGLVAVSENDTDAFVFAPVDSPMERFFTLYFRVLEQNGGLRLQPRLLRGALLEAGFARAEAHGAAEAYGTPERTRWLAAAMAATVASAGFRETVLNRGWAGQAELDELPSAMLAWGERPDALGAALKPGALGWTTDGR
jgi:ubiquinone/menaquinone biosynthesis C-methylase UbiE